MGAKVVGSSRETLAAGSHKQTGESCSPSFAGCCCYCCLLSNNSNWLTAVQNIPLEQADVTAVSRMSKNARFHGSFSTSWPDKQVKESVTIPRSLPISSFTCGVGPGKSDDSIITRRSRPWSFSFDQSFFDFRFWPRLRFWSSDRLFHRLFSRVPIFDRHVLI